MGTSTKRKETFRLKRLCNIEDQIREHGFEIVAGVDEAGRGPLAGPLVAAACILPEGYRLRGIDDSKKLTSQKRYFLYQDLILHSEIHFGIGIIEASEIDALNIHNATMEAMHRAILRLSIKPQFILVDGKHTPKSETPIEAIVEGDQKAQVIAAASILAKVTRDHIMIGYHDLYPEYGFDTHYGYGTKQHLDALARHGPTAIHRMSFKNFKERKNDQKHDSIC